MKNKIKSTLVFLSFAIFLFASCSQNTETVQEKQDNSDFVAVSFTTVASAKSRSMVPDLSDGNNTFFDDSMTVYKLEGKSDTDESFSKTYDLESLEQETLYLRKGNWTFTLSVYEAAVEENIVVAYKATAVVELTDETETIQFTLEPCTGEDVKGNIQFYFTIPEDFAITDHFYAKLLDSENNVSSVVYGDSWETSEDGVTHFVSFNEVPVGTYRIQLNLPSEIEYTEYTRIDDETCSHEDKTASIDNIRNEFGVLVMPNLLTSNKDSPRAYSQLNVLNKIDYSAGFMEDDDIGYYTENIDTTNMILYYNSSLSGNVELSAPEDTKANYIFSYYQTVSDDGEGNTCNTKLESKTVNGSTVWLLPRNEEFTQIDAVYYKTDCKVSIDIEDDAQWQDVSDEDLAIVGQYDSEITLPGSTENKPTLKGWTFVGFSTEDFDLNENVTEETYKTDFGDITFVQPGQQYRISKTEETLYAYWYFNGRCSLDLEESGYKQPGDSSSNTIAFSNNELELSDIEYKTSITLVPNSSEYEIYYSMEGTPEPTEDYLYDEAEKILITEDSEIIIIVHDPSGKCLDSDPYTITINVKEETPAIEVTFTQLTDNANGFYLSYEANNDNRDDFEFVVTANSEGPVFVDYLWMINDTFLETTENSITVTAADIPDDADYFTVYCKVTTEDGSVADALYKFQF